MVWVSSLRSRLNGIAPKGSSRGGISNQVIKGAPVERVVNARVDTRYCEKMQQKDAKDESESKCEAAVKLRRMKVRAEGSVSGQLGIRRGRRSGRQLVKRVKRKSGRWAALRGAEGACKRGARPRQTTNVSRDSGAVLKASSCQSAC